MAEYQQRYEIYCRANCHEPEEQMEIDKERFPGGCMAGFIAWTSQQWQRFSHEFKCNMDQKSKDDHDMFDAWLNIRFPH